MSSMTPGSNVPERCIGEGSAAASPGAAGEVGWPSLGSFFVGPVAMIEMTFEACSEGFLPQVQVRPLEVPQFPAGDELAEAGGGAADEEDSLLHHEPGHRPDVATDDQGAPLHGDPRPGRGVAADDDGPGPDRRGHGI